MVRTVLVSWLRACIIAVGRAAICQRIFRLLGARGWVPTPTNALAFYLFRESLVPSPCETPKDLSSGIWALRQRRRPHRRPEAPRVTAPRAQSRPRLYVRHRTRGARGRAAGDRKTNA